MHVRASDWCHQRTCEASRLRIVYESVLGAVLLCNWAKTTATCTHASSSSDVRSSTPSMAKESRTRETSARVALPCATRSGGGNLSANAHCEQMQSTSCSLAEAYARSRNAALTALRSPCDSHTVLAATLIAPRSKRSSASSGCVCAAATSARFASPLARPPLGSGALAERSRSEKASCHRFRTSGDDARTAQPRIAMPMASRVRRLRLCHLGCT